MIEALLLPLRPHRLAQAAFKASAPTAAALGAAGVAVGAGALAGAIVAGDRGAVAEPGEWFLLSAIWALLLLLPAVAVTSGIVLLATRRRRPGWRWRMVVLSPLAILVPMLVRACGAYWMDTTGTGSLACVGLVLLPLAWSAVMAEAMREPLPRRDPVCAACAYPRAGLPLGAPCPECGAAPEDEDG